jgi:hypothetical protein
MTQPAASASAPQDPLDPGSGAGKNSIAAHPVSAAIITILVAGSILCTLIVPIYASKTPKIGDWPFFYFYLLVYMPAVAIALWICTLLQNRMRRSGQDSSAASTTGAVR